MTYKNQQSKEKNFYIPDCGSKKRKFDSLDRNKGFYDENRNIYDNTSKDKNYKSPNISQQSISKGYHHNTHTHTHTHDKGYKIYTKNNQYPIYNKNTNTNYSDYVTGYYNKPHIKEEHVLKGHYTQNSYDYTKQTQKKADFLSYKNTYDTKYGFGYHKTRNNYAHKQHQWSSPYTDIYTKPKQFIESSKHDSSKPKTTLNVSSFSGKSIAPSQNTQINTVKETSSTTNNPEFDNFWITLFLITETSMQTILENRYKSMITITNALIDLEKKCLSLDLSCKNIDQLLLKEKLYILLISEKFDDFLNI